MAIDLTVPLEEVWSYQQPHVPLLPIVEEGIVFYGDSQRHTTAILEQDRQKLWQSAYRMSPVEWWGGFLVAYVHGNEKAGKYTSGPIQLIEPRSGRVAREIMVPGGCIASASGERWVVGAGIEEQVTIWCLDPREGKLVWSKTLDEGMHVTAVVVAKDIVVFGTTSGEVLAFDAPTGDRRWTSTLADLGWRRYSGQVEPGTVRGRPSVFAFARDTGAFAWTYRTKDRGFTDEGNAAFVVGNNRIYFGNSNLRIRCFGPRVEIRAAMIST